MHKGGLSILSIGLLTRMSSRFPARRARIIGPLSRHTFCSRFTETPDMLKE